MKILPLRSNIDLKEKHKEGMTIILNLIIMFVIFCCFAACMSGCNTQKVATDTEEHIKWHDSTVVNYVQKYDTTHIVDTIKVKVNEQTESENKTDIYFGSGGGTYNSSTGLATNVVSVKTSAIEKQLRETNATLIQELTEIQAEKDSLANRVSNLEEDIKIKETPITKNKMNGYYHFCSWFFWITIVVLLLILAWKIFKKFGGQKYITVAEWIAKILSIFKK